MPTDFYINLKDDREDAASSDSSFREKIHFIIREVGSNKKVLDVGCNDGHIGELLKKNNEVFGIDIVKRKLILAKKRGLKVKQCDIENSEFPYPKDYFDVVILADIIEHVFDTDALLIKSKKVLKKGGKLIITTPNVASLGRRIMLLLGINPFLEFSTNISPIEGYLPVGHIRYYTEQTLRSLLVHNSFTNITIRGDILSAVFFEIPKGAFFSSFCRHLLLVAEK